MTPDQSFTFPEFWNYPPYFTLQPIPETQQKQKQLWRSLILAYCRHHRIFLLDVDTSPEVPLFTNPAINRHLSRSAKLTFFDDLVQHGNAVWLDPKAKQRCLVLWKSATEWADTLYTWALDNGLRDSVVTVDEVILGEDSAGTELHGMHREVFERAVKVLEAQRRAKLFKGATPGEEGIKFF